MKILNFGSCNIDYVYSLDHIVVPGETLSARKREVFPGGKGLNQSVAAARAGAEVFHAGVIGSDGGMLRSVLEESRADTRYLKTADAPNGHAVIQVAQSAQNSIFLYEGTNGMVTKEYIDSVLFHFSPGDILLLQNEISNVPYLIEKGHEKGMVVVFNPAPFDDSLLQLDLNAVDYLILNEVEAKGFFGTEEPSAILSAAAKWKHLHLLVTLGKEGCGYTAGGKVLFCPAFQVEAVDTTAAGDTFTGYFVAMLAAGKPITEALRLGCAASALAVSAMGAAPSIPTYDRVIQALTELKPYPLPAADKDAALRKRLLDYLYADPAQASLDGLAKHLGYSPSYTGSRVKALTGETFGCLLQRIRCERAAAMLRETGEPVSAIIRKVGYQNESFFRTAFRAVYGKTPLQYRKEDRGGYYDE